MACLRGAYVLINDYSLAKTNDLLTEYFRNFAGNQIEIFHIQLFTTRVGDLRKIIYIE